MALFSIPIKLEELIKIRQLYYTVKDDYATLLHLLVIQTEIGSRFRPLLNEVRIIHNYECDPKKEKEK